MAMQTSDYQILANQSPNTGGIGTFLTDKKVIMRCLERWLYMPSNIACTMPV